jgi:L-rhamnose-H+ transport protein
MSMWVGVFLTILAAAINGNFALPMKRNRKWAWENSWMLYSVIAFLAMPLGLAYFTNAYLLDTYHGLQRSEILFPFLFGVGWGISQVLLGISIDRVGMALTFAVVIGLSATLGTLVPLITLHSGTLLSPKGFLILVGILIMLGGIVASAKAGKERERLQSHTPQKGSVQVSNFRMSLAITVAAGILTPMLNYALAFGEPILKRAATLGVTPANATYSVWFIALLGGLPINLFYCIYLLNRNRTWSAFTEKSFDSLRAVLMGTMWMGSIALYGIATTFLGASGAAIGWGLFSIFVILAANLSGLLAGEWKSVGQGPLRTLGFALALLTFASVLITAGNR